MSDTTNTVELDLPVLSGDGVNEFFKSGNIAHCDLDRKTMSSGQKRPSLSSKLRTKMDISNTRGACVTNDKPHKTTKAAAPDDKHSPINCESLYTFRFDKSKDIKRKSAETMPMGYKDSKSRKISESDEVGTHGEVITSDDDTEPGSQGSSTDSDSTVIQDSSPHSDQIPSGRTSESDSVQRATGGDKGALQHSDNVDITDPPDGSKEVKDNSRVLADVSPDMSEGPPEGSQSSPEPSSDDPPGDSGDVPPGGSGEAPGGVVRLGKMTDSGLPMYINSVGVTFAIDLTDEAMDYIRDLAEGAKNGKPPTASKLKYLTVQALEQLIKFNDRPLYKLGTHPELAATVADYIKNGVPPRCPKCKRGALRFSNGKKRHGKKYYWCPGYSPNGFHFYGCNFKAPREEITRTPFAYPT